MYCPKCGNLLPEDAGFCNKCGTSISPIQKERPTVPTASGLLDKVPQNEDTTNVVKKKYTTKTIIASIIVGSAIGIGFGVIESHISANGKKEAGVYSTTQNSPESAHYDAVVKSEAASVVSAPTVVWLGDAGTNANKIWKQYMKDDKRLSKHLEELIYLVYSNFPEVNGNVNTLLNNLNAPKTKTEIIGYTKIYTNVEMLAKLSEVYSRSQISDGYFKEAPDFIMRDFDSSYVLLERESMDGYIRYIAIGVISGKASNYIEISGPDIYRVDTRCAEPIIYVMDDRLSGADATALKNEKIAFPLEKWKVKVAPGENLNRYFESLTESGGC